MSEGERKAGVERVREESMSSMGSIAFKYAGLASEEGFTSKKILGKSSELVVGGEMAGGWKSWVEGSMICICFAVWGLKFHSRRNGKEHGNFHKILYKAWSSGASCSKLMLLLVNNFKCIICNSATIFFAMQKFHNTSFQPKILPQLVLWVLLDLTNTTLTTLFSSWCFEQLGQGGF